MFNKLVVGAVSAALIASSAVAHTPANSGNVHSFLNTTTATFSHAGNDVVLVSIKDGHETETISLPTLNDSIMIDDGPLIRVGTISDRVLQLTTRLSELYDDVEITNLYTEAHVELVKEFQRQNGLIVDGIVGSGTIGRLNHDYYFGTLTTDDLNLDMSFGAHSQYYFDPETNTTYIVNYHIEANDFGSSSSVAIAPVQPEVVAPTPPENDTDAGDVIGALIIGGIIGAILNDNDNSNGGVTVNPSNPPVITLPDADPIAEAEAFWDGVWVGTQSAAGFEFRIKIDVNANGVRAGRLDVRRVGTSSWSQFRMDSPQFTNRNMTKINFRRGAHLNAGATENFEISHGKIKALSEEKIQITLIGTDGFTLSLTMNK